MSKKIVPRAERVTINHEFASVDQFIAEYVTNISRSGVFIRTKQPLDVGTQVNLKFTVIMDELETIEGIGEVVRVQESPLGMGVVFIELTSHSQSLIAKLLTRNVGTAEVGSRATPLPGEEIGSKDAGTSGVRSTPRPPPPPPKRAKA
ncbi:MAG: PilZ domain-containing protein [Deltaproteobacteria bacterium]|nr:PilZ domain-containing protein [Deltaproteobacteria bacterium]